jgi:hypothetical protein
VSVRQIELDLGLNPTPALTIAFAPEVQEALVHLMATAIHPRRAPRGNGGAR